MGGTDSSAASQRSRKRSGQAQSNLTAAGLLMEVTTHNRAAPRLLVVAGFTNRYPRRLRHLSISAELWNLATFLCVSRVVRSSLARDPMPTRLKLLCLVPLLLAASLWIVDPVLVRLLLPFREVLLGLLLLQLLTCSVVIWRLGRSRAGIWALLVVAVAMASLAAVVVCEYDVRERTVTFNSDSTKLVGTLYQPRTGGMHPGMVVLHGSGRFPRRMYRYWAQEFARLGFNVLVYDKRGVGASGGKYEGENNTSDENIEVLARDAANAVDVVASLPDTSRHIGLFGVSQGGWIAPRAAQLNPKVKFLVLHSGPVVSVRQQNLYEKLTDEGHRPSGLTIDEAERQIATVQPSGFDPRETLAHLDVRALWIFGDHDQLVPVRTSIGSLNALAAQGKPFASRSLPGSDHLLLTRSTRFSPRASSEYWSGITEWMEANRNRKLE